MLPPIKEEIQIPSAARINHTEYGLENNQASSTSSSEELNQLENLANLISSQSTSTSSNEKTGRPKKLCKLCDYMTYSHSALDRHYYIEHCQLRPKYKHKRRRPPVIKKVHQRNQQCTCKIIYDNLEELQEYYDRLYKDYAIENLYIPGLPLKDNISLPSEYSDEWEQSSTFISNDNISPKQYQSSDFPNSMSSHSSFHSNNNNGEESNNFLHFISCIKLKKKPKTKQSQRANMNEIVKRNSKNQTDFEPEVMNKKNDLKNQNYQVENVALCNTDSLTSSNITLIQQLKEQNFILNPHKGLSVSLDGKMISSWYQCLYCSLVCNDKEVLVRHYKQDHKHSIFRELSQVKSNSTFSDEIEFRNQKITLQEMGMNETKHTQPVKKLDLKGSWIKGFSLQNGYTIAEIHNGQETATHEDNNKSKEKWKEVRDNLDFDIKAKKHDLNNEHSNLKSDENRNENTNSIKGQVNNQNKKITKRSKTNPSMSTEDSPLSSENTSMLSKLLDEKLEDSFIAPFERMESTSSCSSGHSWEDFNSLSINPHLKKKTYRNLLKELKSEFKQKNKICSDDWEQKQNDNLTNASHKESFNDLFKIKHKSIKSSKQKSKSKTKSIGNQFQDNDDSSVIDLDLFAYPAASSKNQITNKMSKTPLDTPKQIDQTKQNKIELEDKRTIAEKVQYLKNLEYSISPTGTLQKFNQTNEDTLDKSLDRNQCNTILKEVNTHWYYQAGNDRDLDNNMHSNHELKTNDYNKNMNMNKDKIKSNLIITSSAKQNSHSSTEYTKNQKINEKQLSNEEKISKSNSLKKKESIISSGVKQKLMVKNEQSDDTSNCTSLTSSQLHFAIPKTNEKLAFATDRKIKSPKIIPKQETITYNQAEDSSNLPCNSSLRTFQHFKRKLSLNLNENASMSAETFVAPIKTEEKADPCSKASEMTPTTSTVNQLCSMVNLLDVSSDVTLSDSNFTNVTPMDSTSYSDRELLNDIKNIKYMTNNCQRNKTEIQTWNQQRKYLNMVLKELGNEKEANLDDNIGGLFDCSQCLENFQSRGSLNIHLVKSKHLLTCSICFFQCQGIRAMEFHNFLKHNIPILAPL